MRHYTSNNFILTSQTSVRYTRISSIASICRIHQLKKQTAFMATDTKNVFVKCLCQRKKKKSFNNNFTLICQFKKISCPVPKFCAQYLKNKKYTPWFDDYKGHFLHCEMGASQGKQMAHVGKTAHMPAARAAVVMKVPPRPPPPPPPAPTPAPKQSSNSPNHQQYHGRCSTKIVSLIPPPPVRIRHTHRTLDEHPYVVDTNILRTQRFSRKSIMLYKTDISPPSRAVMMTLDAINMPVYQQNVNLYFGNHRTYEFAKMNPTQKVPVLFDEGHIIWDSHAIMQYAVSEYAKDDQLYPKDPKLRSQVDQLLHYDSSVLYPIFKVAAYPIIFYYQKNIPNEILAQIIESYATLEFILQNKNYLVLNRLTLADISCAATVSTLNILHPIDYANYPNLSAWLNKMSREVFYQNQNTRGLGEFHSTFRSALLSSTAGRPQPSTASTP